MTDRGIRSQHWRSLDRAWHSIVVLSLGLPQAAEMIPLLLEVKMVQGKVGQKSIALVQFVLVHRLAKWSASQGRLLVQIELGVGRSVIRRDW